MLYVSNKNKEEVQSYYDNNSSFNYKRNMVLNVPKINLDAVVKAPKNNFKNLDSNLVYYKESSYEDKIIIFGHSGVGYGTYFNRIDELKPNDKAYLYKEKLRITYVVDKTFDVKSTQTSILNDDEKGVLLLITCKKHSKNNRLVVKLRLKSIKTLRK